MSYLSNFSNNIHISFVDSGIVKLVAYHTPVVEDIYHLKIIPKTTGFLLTNSLQRIMVSCSVFFLIMSGSAYILVSQLLQKFTASRALCINLWTWWFHTVSSKTKFPLCFPSSLRYYTQNTHTTFYMSEKKNRLSCSKLSFYHQFCHSKLAIFGYVSLLMISKLFVTDLNNDCTLMQWDMDCTQGWYLVKVNTSNKAHHHQ